MVPPTVFRRIRLNNQWRTCRKAAETSGTQGNDGSTDIRGQQTPEARFDKTGAEEGLDPYRRDEGKRIQAGSKEPPGAFSSVLMILSI